MGSLEPRRAGSEDDGRRRAGAVQPDGLRGVRGVRRVDLEHGVRRAGRAWDELQGDRALVARWDRRDGLAAVADRELTAAGACDRRGVHCHALVPVVRDGDGLRRRLGEQRLVSRRERSRHSRGTRRCRDRSAVRKPADVRPSATQTITVTNTGTENLSSRTTLAGESRVNSRSATPRRGVAAPARCPVHDYRAVLPHICGAGAVVQVNDKRRTRRRP